MEGAKACAPLKQAEVPQQLERLERELMELEEATRCLEESLASVAQPPEPQEDCAKVDQSLTPIASQIRAASGRVDYVTSRLRSINNRLEV